MDQAEELRKRVNESKESSTNNTKVMAITSGKGGVGKTCLAVNLAIQLTNQGKKVVIIDADFGLANVEVMLGIRPQYNLADLVYNNKTVDDLITKGPMDIGFISGGSGVQDLLNLDKERIKILISKLVRLDALADVVIIDTGAGIADSVLEFVLSSPEVLIVVTPEPTSITDAYSLLKAVNRKSEFDPKEKSIKIVANRVENEEEGTELFNKLSLVVSKFLEIKLEYIGAVLQDNNAGRAVIEQKPVSLLYPNSAIVKSYKNIANKLLNNQDSQEDGKPGIAKVFLELIKAKRRK